MNAGFWAGCPKASSDQRRSHGEQQPKSMSPNLTAVRRDNDIPIPCAGLPAAFLVLCRRNYGFGTIRPGPLVRLPVPMEQGQMTRFFKKSPPDSLFEQPARALAEPPAFTLQKGFVDVRQVTRPNQ
jgi:hypothetical protein